MRPQAHQTCTAFSGSRMIASGDIKDVALKVKEHLQHDHKSSILIFDDTTGVQIEVDLRGSQASILKRLEETEPAEPEKKAGPGRPKLGVIAREVTLLPQHWDWLSRQPGGASVTLRKLVEEAKKKNQAKDQIRQAQDAAYKFMNVMAGNLPGYEEALRALYAGDRAGFEKMASPWPKDVRDHAKRLAENAL